MKLKVMTWNVENFFPTGVGAGPKTAAEYDAKLETLRSVISKQDPDVLALQEVGDVNHPVPRSLKDLVAKLGDSYSFEVSKHPDPRGIRVALLVRKTLDATFPAEIVKLPTEAPLPIHDIEGHTLKEMGRGAVRARLQVGGKTIQVVTAHLKSKLLEFPGGAFSTNDEGLRLRVADAALIRRAAEAGAIRKAVTQLLVDGPNDGVVVMGDLNDEALAATTEILYGPPGSQPGTGGFDPADAGDPQRLFNVTGFIPPERRYSRIFEGKKELIDHIMVSRALVPQIDNKHKRHPEVDSLIDYGAGGADGGLPSVPESPGPRQGKPASDHAPIVATFEL
jgi:endonuclease/exonuclease/phosphatase family metal-dependent hydrolase